MNETIYIKFGDQLIQAQVDGQMKNRGWDDRESKAITLEMSYAQARETFVDGLDWSIVMRRTRLIQDVHGYRTEETEIVQEEYDNSEYSLAGDITDHRDGTVTVVMGKPTELELAMELLLAERSMGDV